MYQCQGGVYVRSRNLRKPVWQYRYYATGTDSMCIYTRALNNQTSSTERFRLNADRVNAFAPRTPSSINARDRFHSVSNAFFSPYQESLSL